MIGERLSSEWIAQNQHTESMQLHLERYHYAATLLQNKKTLDIACGTGYGSDILAVQNQVTGADVDNEAVAEAKKLYPHIDFVCEDYQNLTLPNTYDAVVSLETIEHLENPSNFIAFCHTVLKKGGLLILSAPVSYTTDLNKFHLSDFTIQSLQDLIKQRHFACTNEIMHQSQKMFNKENTSKLSTKEYLQLLLAYISNPSTIVKRIKDILKNGLHIKYVVLVYEKK